MVILTYIKRFLQSYLFSFEIFKIYFYRKYDENINERSETKKKK